ncbi:MAG: site-2 protease family protein [Planctomyces sp.]|nr:site-2 protease family protein [Planctomyces sp.]
MFGIDGPTNYDLNFRIFGIPVTVQPWFWLTAALLVWDGTRLEMVLLGIMCVFVSVLVHELGHAIMARRYGFPSQIVLRMFGGYATTGHLPPNRQMAVVFAGPAAGIAFFIIVDGLLFALSAFAPHVLRDYVAVQTVLILLLFTNLIWSIMNLIPVSPMDGGLILQAWLRKSRTKLAAKRELQISIAAAAIVVLWALFCIQSEKNGNPMPLIPLPAWLFPHGPLNANAIVLSIQPDPMFFGILFGYLGVINIVEYQKRYSR